MYLHLCSHFLPRLHTHQNFTLGYSKQFTNTSNKTTFCALHGHSEFKILLRWSQAQITIQVIHTK